MTQEYKDIQPQAEPHIVKSHDIHIDNDYADWIADIKSRYLFYAEKIKKLKQLVSVINAEKMHQAGAELINPKLQQSVGELQFTVNHGIAFQVTVLPRIVNTFALNLNKITMDDLNRLKVVLVEQKKTGKWLAEQLGVSTTTTSRWCSNASQPDLQTLNKIARVLNVNMKDLLTDNEK